MSDTLDRWEIRIGKFLDGELSPQERGLLETELERDRQAKELFEQMRLLHECSCGVVTHEVLGRGADPAEVFERAWQQNQRSVGRGIARGGLQRDGWRWGNSADGHLHRVSQTLRNALGEPRFAVGVAAGLLLGLVLHFVALSPGRGPANGPSPSRGPVAQQSFGPEVSLPEVARNASPGRYTPREVIPVRQSGAPHQVTREVDWYVYTDQAGDQWLIEGTHEGMVKPAVYRDGL